MSAPGTAPAVMLTSAAFDALRDMERKPVPRQEVNPGLVQRLLRDALATCVELESPYATVRKKVTHLQITDAGRAAVRANTGPGGGWRAPDKPKRGSQ